MMQITTLSKPDFDFILSNHSTYWESDLTLRLHHPLFLYEFGDSAFVMKDEANGNAIAAYLLGFVSQTGPVAYVHMVAVHRAYRRQGLARQMYEYFIAWAKQRGCSQLKATADPDNDLSIQFHLGLGMSMQGEDNGTGIKVVRGYLKPGADRVVFLKSI